MRRALGTVVVAAAMFVLFGNTHLRIAFDYAGMAVSLVLLGVLIGVAAERYAHKQVFKNADIRVLPQPDRTTIIRVTNPGEEPFDLTADVYYDGEIHTC